MGFMSVSGMIRRYSCPTRVRSWEGTKDRVRAISQKLESAIAVNNVLAIAPAKKREDLIPSFSILLFVQEPQGVLPNRDGQENTKCRLGTLPCRKASSIAPDTCRRRHIRSRRIVLHRDRFVLANADRPRSPSIHLPSPYHEPIILQTRFAPVSLR